MKLKKEAKLSLSPEKCVYPWQILEADGETWLIMRWREKVAAIPIVDLSNVVMENFCWELACQEGDEGEKRLFVGNIGFKAVYQEERLEQNPYADEEPCWEEMLCEDLLTTKCPKGLGGVEKKSRDELTAHSSFPSLLLAGEELDNSKINEQAKANKTWQVQSPWRCWVKNSTGSLKPVCLKVHLTQVGLYTLLLEVLIKLKPEPEGGQENKPIQFPEQKYILQVKDDSPAEVWGVAVDRAFPRFVYHAKEKKLSLQYLKRLSMIYLSSREGGERFVIASSAEENSIFFEEKEKREPLYPLGFALGREKSDFVLAGDKICYYREREHGSLEMEIPTQQTEEKSIAVNGGKESSLLTLPKRCKPGERWLKKGEGNREKKMKTVLTIKV